MGNFDGIHLGHQAVIRPILSSLAPVPDHGTTAIDTALLQGFSDRWPLRLDADEMLAKPPSSAFPAAASLPTVVTFYPHPREFFAKSPRPWLTPLGEKADFLRQLGVEQLILLPFNRELAALSPQAFVKDVLLNRLQVRRISVGSDFRFGANREGDVTLLHRLAKQQGVSVTVVELAQDSGERISSSRIRQALHAGDVRLAKQLLGRPYRLCGRVVRGQQLGRQLGFPTANLQLSGDKFLPRTGVYSVLVYGVPGGLPGQAVPGVMNLGVRPTINGQQQTIEVHLLNWQGSLYNSMLTVAIEGFLRPEQRFASLDELKAQIQNDCEHARTRLQVGSQ